VGDESDRPLRLEARLAEGAGQLEGDGDPGRVVEGGAEPAVVVAGHDQRRATAPPGEDPDDVRGLGPAGERRPEHDLDPALQLRRVFLADRDARWSLCMPDAVEGAEGIRRLVERPARGQ
jgi:hypothetical protein